MCLHVNFNLRNIESDSHALQICNHPLRKSEHQLVGMVNGRPNLLTYSHQEKIFVIAYPSRKYLITIKTYQIKLI